MATPSKFKTSKEAKQAGWFSRRHPDNKALEEARTKRNQKKNDQKENN